VGGGKGRGIQGSEGAPSSQEEEFGTGTARGGATRSGVRRRPSPGPWTLRDLLRTPDIDCVSAKAQGSDSPEDISPGVKQAQVQGQGGGGKEAKGGEGGVYGVGMGGVNGTARVEMPGTPGCSTGTPQGSPYPQGEGGTPGVYSCSRRYARGPTLKCLGQTPQDSQGPQAPQSFALSPLLAPCPRQPKQAQAQAQSQSQSQLQEEGQHRPRAPLALGPGPGQGEGARGGEGERGGGPGTPKGQGEGREQEEAFLPVPV